MTRTSLSLTVVGMAFLLTVACALSAVAPTPTADISTIIAATLRAIATPSYTAAPEPTPQPAPTLPAPTPAPTFTQSPPPPTRLNFVQYSTTGLVTGTVDPNESLPFILQAGVGQPMLVNVDSVNEDITVSIKTEGGTSLLSPAAKQSSWRGSLPATEDYIVTVIGGASTEDFTLTVQLADRIKFAEGSTSAKVSAKTVAGHNIAYTTFAVKDKKMDIVVSTAGGKAALEVWGYADGQVYLRAEAGKSSFKLKVPTTQDYIIEVVPKASGTISYVLLVEIQE